MFQILSEIPLPGQGKYRGMAYDGCRLYLTRVCKCAVTAVDHCGCTVASFDTCRCYSCLCYDPVENCFWAASDATPSTLFKLDRCLREIDCLHLQGHCAGIITSVSLKCCAGALLVSFADRLVLADKAGCTLWEQKACCWITGALSVCPWYFTWCPQEGATLVRLWDREHCLVRECRLPCGCSIEAAVYDPCETECGCPAFYVLVTRHGCYPYLLHCSLEDCRVCCSICPCNDLPCCCEEPEPCKEPCQDLLESIALIEASLSHILNAEGEKLQRIIAATDNPCTLLAVNKSVNTTLVNAIHLEQVLYHKLESAKEICGCLSEDFCPPMENDG